MRYRLLGNSGLRVSEFCLGTMTFGDDWGWGTGKDDCRKIYDTFRDAGGNFFDTANFYTNGTSETLVGEFMQEHRESVVLSTKYSNAAPGRNANATGNHRKSMMHTIMVVAAFVSRAAFGQASAVPPEPHRTQVSFKTQDGGLVYADVYGKGARGVVLAHGGQFNKESWEKQARILEKAGFHVLAIDFRGYGRSQGPGQSDPMGAPLQLDVLAAVRYLRKAGARTVTVVGASMGGSAAADAVIEGKPGEIEGLVVLGAGAGNLPPAKITVRKLFIVSRQEASASGPRLPGIQNDYDRMQELGVRGAIED